MTVLNKEQLEGWNQALLAVNEQAAAYFRAELDSEAKALRSVVKRLNEAQSEIQQNIQITKLQVELDERTTALKEYEDQNDDKTETADKSA